MVRAKAWWVWLALLTAGLVRAEGGAAVGQRPYEMDWAGRTQDAHPALVDFEDLTGWTVDAQEAVASIAGSREQQLFGQGVGKLTYRGTGTNPVVTIRPPQPIAIAAPFDTLSVWIYGNNWAWESHPDTPSVNVIAMLQDAKGNELGVHLATVYWKEWFLCQRRLTPEQIAAVKGGAKLTGIRITDGRNTADRVLYFDSLCAFREDFAPLKLSVRPQRGVAMFPGQTVGMNTGAGKLPFPTREETILPDNLARDAKTQLREAGGAYEFVYQGSDGKLTWRLEPKTGTLADLTAQWQGRGEAFRPCVGGGVYLAGPKGPVAPEKAEPLGTKRQGDAVVSRWRLTAGEANCEASYTYRLWGKSLVIDVAAPGGQVAEVRYGRAVGLADPRVAPTPYYRLAEGRPAVVAAGPAAAPLFLAGNTDWYRSNASLAVGANGVDEQGVVYNGGTRYIAKTDGRRNDCYERLFLTVSPRYEEVLPTVANPKSPYMAVTGTHVWRAHGAGNREADIRYWRNVHRWGMTELAITDHETMWRDGGESFTFRTKAAPGKGGDEGAAHYARVMQDELGFVYGPYNNYTDFSPVNEFWSTDRTARTPDNQLQPAWARCYGPKPAYSVEACEALAPIMQRKFHFSTAYCDVHTAVAPWDRVDYDARVPGAGTFAATFYAYGEIMLLQKKAWGGPVYSEGNHHAFYAGLTDGNYGQDQAYGLHDHPWLVDFDLRKLHDLNCNFGMGNPDMFYSGHIPGGSTPAERDMWLDRFLAATVAYGHPGFLVLDGGMRNALRSYYLLQQLHSRYCLAHADDIRYADASGKLLDSSAAVASGAYQRSQVATRYSDGTVTVANGSPTERMAVDAFGHQVDLPPNGYAGWTADGAIQVLSGELRGHRADYAVTPAYLYVDGRGHMARFAKAAGSGQGICRSLPGGQHELLLYEGADCGFAVDSAGAVALDEAGKEMGPATLRSARGLTYVMPVAGAFSYRLAAGKAPAGVALTCPRDEVYAGETVTVQGRERHTVAIPQTAKPGERIWQQLEGGWIDFTVVPFAEAEVALEGNALAVTVTSHLPNRETLTVSALGVADKVIVAPGATETARLDLGKPTGEDARLVAIELRQGELVTHREVGLTIQSAPKPLAAMPERYVTGTCIRGGQETLGEGYGGYVHAQSATCGGVTRKGWFMHPPWQGAVGYSYLLTAPLTVPKEPASFRALVGKADGSYLGDGILYKLVVRDADGKNTVAGEQTVKDHEWVAITADLTPWAGKTVRLQLISDVGPQDDSSGDWACWAEARIESREPILQRSLLTDAEALRREPGPYPLEGLTVEQLRGAKGGWLRYDGQGLEGGAGEHKTTLALNGVDLGATAPAGGDEVKGVWAEKVGVPLTPAAIATLGRRNKVTLKNPGEDYYKVRRFWLELELADGRKVSSDIAAAAFTQPPGWQYGEGILVPMEQPIEVDVWFGGM